MARPIGGDQYLLTFPGDPPSVGRDLALRVSHYLAVSGQLVKTTGYHFGFLTQTGLEIVVYHWHPTTPSAIWPHLHLGSGAGVTRAELYKVHIPTGEVTWSEVIALLDEWTRRVPAR